jgi:hypothetical protein
LDFNSSLCCCKFSPFNSSITSQQKPSVIHFLVI